MNTDQKRRDDIMKLEAPRYFGGLEKFEDLEAEQLEVLISENFIDPKYKYKTSPSVEEFLDFIKSNPGVVAHGYVISSSRPDCRICVEGLRFVGKTTDDLKNIFSNFCKTATDCILEKDELYSCW